MIKRATERYRGLRPGNRAERWSLFKGIALVVAGIALAGGLWALQRHQQRARELTWNSANGRIEDVRPVVAGLLGRGVVYRVEVLAKYTFESVPREQWITVSEGPRTLEDAQGEAIRLKGRPCVVRWNSSRPEQIVVEI